jgi:hypothetical protein
MHDCGGAYIDAISASEVTTSVVPSPAKILPYTIDAGPPLLSANWNVTAAASQEHCNTKEKLTVETRLMYRYNTRKMVIAVCAMRLPAYLKSAARLRILFFVSFIVNGLLSSDIVSLPSPGRQLQVLIHGHFLCANRTTKGRTPSTVVREQDTAASTTRF